MVWWELTRPTTSALLLTTLGAERGVPVARCLAGTGLTRELLDDPQATVTAEQELRLTANLLEALGHPPGFGVEAGSRYHATTHGMWGFALISSPTLRSAIDIGIRFLDLSFSFCRIRSRATDDAMELVIDAPDVPPGLRRFAVERDVGVIHTLHRDLLAAPGPLHRVTFTFPAPRTGAQRYADVLGLRPEFDAPENVVAVDAALLDTPLPQADAHAAALTEAQCRRLLAARTTRSSLSSRVRGLLLANPANPPDRERVAAALSISERTLHRRLVEEGSSYRELLEEVRKHLAEELLVTAGLPVAEVARRLGYAEISSFSQAFRRWNGLSPRAYRTSLATQRHG